MKVLKAAIYFLFRFFEAQIDPFPVHEPTTPPSNLIGFYRHYIRGSERQLFFLALGSTAIALIEVGLYGALGSVVDWMAQANQARFLVDYGLELAGLSLLLLVCAPLVLCCYSMVLHQGLLGNLPMRIRWLGHRYLLRQTVSFYADDFAGRVSTKLMQTALSLRDSVIKMCDVLLHISVYFISIVLLLGATDWRLALPLLAWAVMYGCILWYFLPRMKAVAAAQADARSLMTGRVVDAYSNITTVKLFSHTQRETEYARDAMSPFLETVHRQMRLATSLDVLVHSSVYLAIFLEFMVCIVLWQEGSVSLGMVGVAVMVTIRLNGLASWIMWEALMFFEHLGTVSDGMATLSKPFALTDAADAKPLQLKSGAIEFRNVSFHYGKGYGVIDRLSLNVLPGEKIGIVGRSGAGKTTMINLLLRLYDVEAGAILIDGQAISSVTQESVRQHIGVVTQDASLLHRTVRENVLYGKPDATEAQVRQALQQAHADQFIETLQDQNGSKGLDALVGERGVKLSGGQRQRIAIARVLLKNAPVLLLDEATSALDSEVEQAIQDSLHVLMEGKTVIAIAHRLSTIASLDRLIVIDHGRIVEQGDHQQLMALNGLYAQLWARQTGGFLGSDL